MQVPPKLRAALFDLVGAFATEPASAAKIWCAVRVRHPVGSVCVTRSARACRAYLEKAAVVQKPADAGTGFFYVTKKNSRTQTEKMVKKKYDPVAKKHVEFRETKIK